MNCHDTLPVAYLCPSMLWPPVGTRVCHPSATSERKGCGALRFFEKQLSGASVDNSAEALPPATMWPDFYESGRMVSFDVERTICSLEQLCVRPAFKTHWKWIPDFMTPTRSWVKYGN